MLISSSLSALQGLVVNELESVTRYVFVNGSATIGVGAVYSGSLESPLAEPRNAVLGIQASSCNLSELENTDNTANPYEPPTPQWYNYEIIPLFNYVGGGSGMLWSLDFSSSQWIPAYGTHDYVNWAADGSYLEIGVGRYRMSVEGLQGGALYFISPNSNWSWGNGQRNVEGEYYTWDSTGYFQLDPSYLGGSDPTGSVRIYIDFYGVI
jgi:hypothetical protein